MKVEDYKYMINSYFDGDLDREKEALLFTYLSQNEECREYFKSMNLLKSSVEKTNEEFPNDLEERIFYSLQKTEGKKLSFFSNNLFAVASYTLAAILIVISILFYNESNSYKAQLEKTIKHINKQEQIMNILLNNLPAATVTASYEDEVIVTSKM